MFYVWSCNDIGAISLLLPWVLLDRFVAPVLLSKVRPPLLVLSVWM